MIIDCFILLLLSFFFTVLLTPQVRRVLEHFGFWNAKDTEHEKIVVRGGGIAVILSFLITMFIASFWMEHSIAKYLLCFLAPVFVLMVIGIWDDRFSMHPKLKLILQMVPFVILWLFDLRINRFLEWGLPWYVSLFITVFWGICILNAFNLIDGLDGLCSGTTLLASATFFVCALLSGNVIVMIISLTMIGCCAGFLCFNYHPAKLFLGDTGSLFMGLSCATMSLCIARGNFSINMAHILVLIFWLPFCDMGMAFWRRSVQACLRGKEKKGGGVMDRDLMHIHYRLKEIVNDHAMTVHILWFFMFLIDMVALYLFYIGSNGLTLIVFWVISLLSLISLANYEISLTSRLINNGLRWLCREIFKIDMGNKTQNDKNVLNQQSTNGDKK